MEEFNATNPTVSPRNSITFFECGGGKTITQTTVSQR